MDKRPDPVKAALAAARGLGRTGRKPKRSVRTGDDAAPVEPGRNRGGYSGPGPDDSDPQALGAVLAQYTDDRGWDRPLAEARVFADWTGLVGPEVAAHCAPAALRDGELRIAAQSTSWATQLRLLSATILARLVDELGPQVVTRIVVTGPVGPSWKHGRLSVPGSRGPRDTYG